MGKPKEVKAAKVDENYNWGIFGSADADGVKLSPMASANVSQAQAGANQYLQELINPSYNNASFRARQELLDASNRQYANELGAAAIARGARGSATQNILNSVMANRNNNMRTAMTQEDARLRNVLNSLQGVESGYFNQANSMAGNILNRVLANQSAQNAVNMYNTQARNQWANNLISGVAGIGGAALGGWLGGLGANAGGSLADNILAQAAVPGAAVDPMQALSGSNSF